MHFLGCSFAPEHGGGLTDCAKCFQKVLKCFVGDGDCHHQNITVIKERQIPKLDGSGLKEQLAILKQRPDLHICVWIIMSLLQQLWKSL